MKQRLIQYVEWLFSGVPGGEDMKQEILQNTLDRYDDLLAQGKSEEAAYRLAISGIGDISEILGTPETIAAAEQELDPEKRRRTRAIAIALYIVCAIPLFVFSEFGLHTIGLCLTLVLVAVATYLILLSRNEEAPEAEFANPPEDNAHTLKKKKAGKIIWIVGLIAYLILSLTTQAWFTTWLMFPILGCIEGLANAILDLKEVNRHEE